VVVNSKKAIGEIVDFNTSQPKKIIMKDLVFTLREDPLHKHKELVYSLQNRM
jgi:hypothetical protein